MKSGKITGLGWAVILLLVFGKTTAAYQGKHPRDGYTPPEPYATSFPSRLQLSETNCLSPYADLAAVTFSYLADQDSNYRPSLLQKVLVPFHSVLQSLFQLSPADQKLEHFATSKLKILGKKADETA